MKFTYSLSIALVSCVFCFSIHPLDIPSPTKFDAAPTASFTQSSCQSSWQNNVNTYKIYDGGQEVGTSIWLSRGSKRVKAKYFAHKKAGQSVHDRYDAWRQGKDILLMSSGAYATGWDSQDIPAGITVDNGNIVNRSLDPRMDGLVIVEAVGGVRVSNIEEGRLWLASINEHVDVNTPVGRAKFLRWAQSENATVFQTHLLVYDNQLKFATNRSNSSARRKFLILATDNYGNLFHIIFYLKHKSYTLYESSQAVLNFIRGKNMDFIASVNLDTGDYDIINTGGGVKDCRDDYIIGTRNKYRQNLTNMLVYQFE